MQVKYIFNGRIKAYKGGLNMANNSLLSSLLTPATLKGIASMTGVSANDVSSILTSALPTLLNGASKQSSQAKTAESFANALLQHADKDTKSISTFLKNVDIDDGAKIVSHLLGATGTTSATKKAAKESGIDAKTVAKVLSIAAPLLMSLLGKQSKKDNKKGDTLNLASVAGSLLSNADVGSLLTGLLKK